MTTEMSIAIGIIVLLVGALYASILLKIAELGKDLAGLRVEVTSAVASATQAAASASQAAATAAEAVGAIIVEIKKRMP